MSPRGDSTPGATRPTARGSSRDAYLIDGVRTPFGRHGGALAAVRADDLLAHVIAALVERTGVPADRIDDVLVGCANQAGEDNRNVARMGLLLAGLPVSVPGATVNRLCGSGMQAFTDAARLVQSGEADLVVAGGVEQMTRAPWVMPKTEGGFARGNQTLFDTTLGWRMVNPRMEKLHGALALGITAEKVAERCGVTRAEQDELALRSQRRAGAALESGRLAQEITPIQVGTDRKTGAPILFSRDEHPRPDTTLEKLAALAPAFQKDGTVTAGNSSGLNDGAVAMLVASERAASELGLKPLARYVSSAAAGVEVSYMGLGPIPATHKALALAGLEPRDLAVSEINEAFAAQAVPCIREIGLDPETVNVNGGAIAIGHPLGASGARLVLTLARELAARGERYGLATMCIGVGQGIAAILERV
jgi:3-oxoadipyl-CoA thiolase